MKKRLGLILALLLCVQLLGAGALADEEEAAAAVRLGGQTLAEGYWSLGEDGMEAADEDGYDIALDGAELSLNGAAIGAGIEIDGDAELVLSGVNSVEAAGGVGIYCGGSLAISGTGSLSVRAGAGHEGSAAIYVEGGLTVSGGSITARGAAPARRRARSMSAPASR